MRDECLTENRQSGLLRRAHSRAVYETKLLSGLKGAEKPQSCHRACLTKGTGRAAAVPTSHGHPGPVALPLRDRQGSLPGPCTQASEVRDEPQPSLGPLSSPSGVRAERKLPLGEDSWDPDDTSLGAGIAQVFVLLGPR